MEKSEHQRCRIEEATLLLHFSTAPVNRLGDSRKVLRLYGKSTLSEFLDDLVVYRNLAPADSRVPDLDQLRPAFDLVGKGIPRKSEPTYAAVVAKMLRAAHRANGGDGQISSLLMLGDTEHNDGTAFRNLCTSLGCPGAAFICDETGGPPNLQPVAGKHNWMIYLANRWRLLDEFDRTLASAGLTADSQTAVVIDIDKTAIGARGRNHRPIDAARRAAVGATMDAVLGDEVDHDRVFSAYDALNVPAYHSFTTDNQDYLAYLAMLAGCGWSSVADLTHYIGSGVVQTFGDLLEKVTNASESLPTKVREVHFDVTAAVAAGDPTPFKRFRRAEFSETVRRMSKVENPDDLESILASNITITQEVREVALRWRARGALLFGLSDKPDEASIPSDELAEQGYLPLHRTEAFVVGES